MGALPKRVRSLISEYLAFQGKVPLREAEPDLRDLTRFKDNKGKAVHNWFVYEEGFSADLLPWLCKVTSLPLEERGNLLDPFCGVGTSILSAQLEHKGERPFQAYGIEHNPFVRFVAEAKVSWPAYRPERIESLIPKLLSRRLSEGRATYQVPTLSTINNPDVFPPHVVRDLLALRDRIRNELNGEPEESFFLLGWASAIERVSGVRKDGRALRFTEKEAIPSVSRAVQAQWEVMLRDLKSLKDKSNRPTQFVGTILAGDGRKLENPELRGKSFDLIFYSPPYLNNIDYSEVYKLELWLSGFVANQDEFKSLRLGTLRSHPSVKFPETQLVERLNARSWPRRLRDALLDALPRDDDLAWRQRLIQGYMDDMYLALSSQYTVSCPGGIVACVVGNSLHGGKNYAIPVATDLLICSLARSVGFKLERLQIARQLRRRDHANSLLRESIILLRRPV